MAVNRAVSLFAARAGSSAALASRPVKMPRGNRPSSSANMQNRHWIRKCATGCESSPRRRRVSARSPKRPAASAVIAASDLTGRSFSGSVNTQRRVCRCLGLADVGDRDAARFVGVAGEGGVDLDPLAVADHQQRRVVEFQAVVGELLQRGAQVAPGPLVLPAEMAALPDVGPAAVAFRAAGLAGAALETVVVGIARLVHAEQFAQIVEMPLRPGAFGERVVLPEGDELGGGHARILHESGRQW
jgi:hypothetical protein